jgi:Glycosyl transferases group 1
MRIFLSCQQALKKHNIPAYSFWEVYFKEGCQEAGYEWIEAEAVDWAEGLSYKPGQDLESWKERTWSSVVYQIKKLHQEKPIDIFLGYLFPNQVEPSAVSDIQALGIPCVNFFCDNVREFTRVPDSYHCFDLHWVPEHKALKMYQKAGLNFFNAAMPVWVSPHQRTCEHPENYGVSFIGRRDLLREVLIAEALKLGASIDIRGPGWISDNQLTSELVANNRNLWKIIANQAEILVNQGAAALLWKTTYRRQPRIADEVFEKFVRETVFGSKYQEVTQQSRITLGINRYPSFHYPFYKPDNYSRLRDIEAPMMGACYLTEWTDGLEKFFELGEEIETYRTAEEMVEKIRELETNPLKRKKMRCQAQKRALTEHTVAKSLTKIANFIGL